MYQHQKDVGSAVLLSSFVATSVLAQDAPYNEEFMQRTHASTHPGFVPLFSANREL
jgi:hypothetical protein